MVMKQPAGQTSWDTWELKPVFTLAMDTQQERPVEVSACLQNDQSTDRQALPGLLTPVDTYESSELLYPIWALRNMSQL